MSYAEQPHYFRDKKRSVDFILVWDEDNALCIDPDNYEYREVFEDNLLEEGLEIEYDLPTENTSLFFVKVHAPIQVLKNYAEILRLKFPLKPELQKYIQKEENNYTAKSFFRHDFYGKGSESERLLFNFYYSKDKEDLFEIDKIFTPACKAKIVHFVLDRTPFIVEASDDTVSFGLKTLIHWGIYIAAYPLHDVGALSSRSKAMGMGHIKKKGSMRSHLYTEWALMKNWYKPQPLDFVNEYFGSHAALYFAWLNFYVKMLVPVSLIGTVVFIYGMVTQDQEYLREEVCSSNAAMCPRCDGCHIWPLSDNCFYVGFLNGFDNAVTPMFAAIMAVWAVLFMVLWERNSAILNHHWVRRGASFNIDLPQPEYLGKIESYRNWLEYFRINCLEEKISLPSQLSFITIGFVGLILLILIFIACFTGVASYRLSLMAATAMIVSREESPNFEFLSSFNLISITLTGSVINFFCMQILSFIYNYLALKLTMMECRRTSKDFEDALITKMFILQFVNSYCNLFYLAFIKGQVKGYPGWHIRVFNYRPGTCPAFGSCLWDITCSLGTVLILEQVLNSFTEFSIPRIAKLWRLKFKKFSPRIPQWQRDFYLDEFDLNGEYLEMVQQYGYVTMFVSAFPLAPLCALINNVVECRYDARKVLLYRRRPVASHGKSIGQWMNILRNIGRLAIFTNALLIAFTSEFIPKIIYRLFISDDQTLRGYVNHSLSVILTDDLDGGVRDNKTNHCYYQDYRYPPYAPGARYKYQLTSHFWIVLAARLLFVVIFQNLVSSAVTFLGWAIPTRPADLVEIIHKEKVNAYNIIVEQTKNRNKKKEKFYSWPR